jgi:hypothetical protein
MAERTQQSRRAERPAEPAGGVQVPGPRHRRLTQLAAALNRPAPALAAAGGGAGDPLPDRLRHGVEALSGLAMDPVRVHYDSPRPAQLRAHAFAQGGDIHLAPGQAHHLPHEAWHVVQQAQGRVKPTAQLKGGVDINDDSGLEREADAMGARALAMTPRPAAEAAAAPPLVPDLIQAKAVVQRAVWEYTDAQWLLIDGKGGTAPTGGAPREGMVYDDVADIVYPDIEAYERAVYHELRGSVDLPEDDLSDEFLPDSNAMAEDEEDDEDAGPGMEEEGESDPDRPDMDFETRRTTDEAALRMPLTGSRLTAPDARFKSRTMASRDKFKVGKVMGQRTQQAGAVSITLQSVPLWVNDKVEVRERPVAVVGLVDPSATTGRGGAPDPLSGYQVYSGQGRRPTASIASERNSGAHDVERGHVMALELGGPDIAENIVPQWAKFQGSGEWRRMEVAVLAKAKALKKGQQLRYRVEIFYKSSGDITPTLRTFGFPTGFKATTQVIEGKNEGGMEVEFHQGQAQDQTDQMLSERVMRKLDGPDWDPRLDRQKPGGRKKREPVKAAKGPGKIRKASKTKVDSGKKRAKILAAARKQLEKKG